ncbi:MAG: hydrogenase maturation nickel metallochaperone HypA [Deltaproteobacteria bacterium]|nr:hydrogenase maturation nickel metallochaperone HypA [Deltaproteobacteria bacterium]
MHESSLIAGLLIQVEGFARRNASSKVVSVRIRIGAHCGLSPDHLRHHFLIQAQGTVAEGARLEIVEGRIPSQSHQGEVLLDSLEVMD